jgi:hypothetical protein
VKLQNEGKLVGKAPAMRENCFKMKPGMSQEWGVIRGVTAF